MSELKPCPFCGGEAELCYSEVDTFCRKCNVIQETEMWNTRPIEDELRARIAELEEENERLAQLLHDEMSQLEIATDLGKKMEHWRDTALQLSRNNGEAQAKINALEADYVISNRELLVKQVEIQGLTARIAELEGELAELKERFDITDGLLNQATVSIGAVIACCTYNSNAEAMAGAFGISYRAFAMIDNFIKNYNRAVLDGKASTDVKNIICWPPNPPEVQE